MANDQTNQDAYERVQREVHAAYQAETPKSKAWHARASKSLVAGVSGTDCYFSPYPLYFSHGSGSRETDIDDNTYIDCFLCGACHLLGHRPPAIMSAIEARAESGSLALNPAWTISENACTGIARPAWCMED